MPHFLLALLGCSASFASGQEAVAPPNLVVLVADDLGVGDVGWMDSAGKLPADLTPELDRLAAEGVRFEQLRAFPLCSPSRAALLTGRSPVRFGLAWNPIRPWSRLGLPPTEKTVADSLHQVGYHTVALGKWHLGHSGPDMLPNERGFDHFYGYLNGVVDHRAHRTRSGGHDWQRNGQSLKESGHVSELVAAEAESLIGDHDFAVQPLFLYLAFSAPHQPLQADAKDLAAIPETLPPARRAYLAMVRQMDRSIGRVRKALEERDQWHNTLVVFLSDNGADTEFGGDNGPFSGTKGGCGEAGLRVPGLIHWPGHLPAGGVDRAPRSLMDLLPTLVDAAGGTAAGTAKGATLDGVSWLTSWTPQGPASVPAPPPTLAASGFGANGQNAVHLAVLDGNWKLLHRIDRRSGEHQDFLYDLAKDPYEQRNVARSHKFRVRKMTDRLRGWLALADDPQWRHLLDSEGGAVLPPWPDSNPPAGWTEPEDWALGKVTRSAPAADTEQPTKLSFARQIQPILAENCLLCHGADPSTRKAGLRLDSRAGMLADLDGYSAVVPGDPEDSELIYRIRPDDPDDRMPPPEQGPALSDHEVELLRRWIGEGAIWEDHWAWQPFHEVRVPPATRSGNPIDAFVAARLKQQGLTALPLAPPRDQLRRLALDLTGLPPTKDELQTFLADPSDAAYVRAVDHYLTSSHFAVRWARHWLDLARYADSHGFTIDGGRSIWPWRDWVVDAIDRDLPYDQFTIEQLAGDLLPDASRAQRVATGFHRNTQVNQEGGAKDEENRIHAVIDRVNTTGTVWLGVTLGCAQCHTHKFDPITQEEYYRFLAFFNQTTDGGVSAEPSMLVPRTQEEEVLAAAWEHRRQQLCHQWQAESIAARQGWTNWQPVRAWGSNGPELRPEEDGSYRVIGQNPVYSTYFLQGRLPLPGLGSLRLEALPAEGLPAGGPGRAGNGNFVVQQVRVLVRPWHDPSTDSDPGHPWTLLDLVEPRSDFDQDTRDSGGGRYPFASAVAADGGPGWAVRPRFGQPHVATVDLAAPLDPGEWELRVEIQQEHGDHHTLGAFRLAVRAEGAPAAKLVPESWVRAWQELEQQRRVRPALPTTLVLEARRQQRTTHLFHRGSFLDPRQAVQPGVPAAFDRFRSSDHGESPRRFESRLDLARWLTDPRNALGHRVTVNRWWQFLFGRGLVATENDFGLRGAAPSHPELLEWLAQEFVRGGMSRKHLLRQIVLSDTYRRSSRADSTLRDADPDNRWLARQQRLRLDGEVIRDAALAVSGLLDPRLGGPPVQPLQPEGVFSFTQARKRWEPSAAPERFRRSLYTRLWRSSPFPFYRVFDAPAATTSCTRRNRSNTPLQALAMANDPMVQEWATALGVLLLEQPSLTVGIDAACVRVLGRSATTAEIDVLASHWQEVAARRDPQAAWTAVARVLLNLDEFLSRP